MYFMRKAQKNITVSFKILLRISEMIVEECSTVWLTEISLSIRSSIFKEVWLPRPIRVPQMKHRVVVVGDWCEEEVEE